jgi:hypothetical protein
MDLWGLKIVAYKYIDVLYMHKLHQPSCPSCTRKWWRLVKSLISCAFLICILASMMCATLKGTIPRSLFPSSLDLESWIARILQLFEPQLHAQDTSSYQIITPPAIKPPLRLRPYPWPASDLGKLSTVANSGTCNFSHGFPLPALKWCCFQA